MPPFIEKSLSINVPAKRMDESMVEELATTSAAYPNLLVRRLDYPPPPYPTPYPTPRPRLVQEYPPQSMGGVQPSSSPLPYSPCKAFRLPPLSHPNTRLVQEYPTIVLG